MSIYPDEKMYIPKIGDTFIVTKVSPSTDMHWGKCIYIELTLSDDVCPLTDSMIEDAKNATNFPKD